MRKPDVVLVAHGVHDNGGMERSLAELVRHTCDDVRFHVVTTTLAPDLEDVVDWIPIRVPQTPVPALFTTFYVRASRALRGIPRDLTHSMGALHAQCSDLISVQFCHAAFRELPSDQRAVDGGALRSLNRRVDLRIALEAERRAYRPGRVRAFAAASSGVQRELGRFYPAVHSTVVPNGFGPAIGAPGHVADRDATRSDLGYGPEDLVYLFLGGDWKRKGLALAIEAFARAVRAAPGVHMRLAVVGPGDPRAHAARADALGVGGRVRFFGRTDAPGRFFAAADVFVFPTAYEAFPLVAIEAAAAGLPVIATPVNGIEDLIDHGRSGLLVDRDAESLAVAMGALAVDPPRRDALGRAGARSASHYTWASAARRTLGMYERLLSERPRV